jgi:hypothetical protein
MPKTLNEQMREREARSEVEASIAEKVEQLDVELSYATGELLRLKREYTQFRNETIAVINKLAAYIEQVTKVEHGGETPTEKTN